MVKVWIYQILPSRNFKTITTQKQNKHTQNKNKFKQTNKQPQQFKGTGIELAISSAASLM